MKNETDTNIQKNNQSSSAKKKYDTPALQLYGKLNRLTQGSGGGANDGGGVMSKGNGKIKKPKMSMSDRRTKENIFKIGTHPIGIGLYLFDYKTKFLDGTNSKRQFGVMADEVEKVMPSAVSIGQNGYKHVDYSQLNIQLNH